MTKYFYNNRTTYCVMTSKIFGINVSVKGVSKCSPTDEFNQETGKKLAKLRALNKLKRKELRVLDNICKEFYKTHHEFLDRVDDRYDRCEKVLNDVQNELKTFIDSI